MAPTRESIQETGQVIRMKTMMKHLLTNIQAIADMSELSETSRFTALRASKIYHDSLTKMIKDNGKIYASKHFKLLHRHATERVLGDTPSVIPFCKSDKDGYPKQLICLKDLIESGCKDSQRLALTITRFFESIYCKPELDPTPITDEGPNLDENFLQDFDEFCKGFTHRLRISGSQLQFQDTVIGSLKMGPNGPAIATAHRDAVAVLQNESLWEGIYTLAKRSHSLWICRMLHNNAKVTEGQWNTGRIALIPEGGCKTRTIAIGDYWSQNVLRPIHDRIMSILRRLDTNGTYEQGYQFDRIQIESEDRFTDSIDATSWTDRFPIELQEILLSHVYDKEIALAWRHVLTNREFAYKDTSLVWGRGQPLGLLSSWAVASLTHHAFTEYCAFKATKKLGFRKYAILGDDIVIWDKSVSTMYRRLMKEIGVSISESKSFTSQTGAFFEFAKRISLNGEEYSGIKWNVFNKTSTLDGWMDLTRVLDERHFTRPLDRVWFPRDLSSKRSRHLAFLLLERYGPGLCPYLNRVTQESMFTPELHERLIKEMKLVRAENLEKQMHRLETALMNENYIGDYFSKEGVAVSEQLLDSYEIEEMHPVIVDMNRKGERMYEVLGSLDQYLEYPDQIDPVEYIPIPSRMAYFGDMLVHRQKYRRLVVLEASKRLVSN